MAIDEWEPGGTFDRDQAREVLAKQPGINRMPGSYIEAVLDRLAECVRPTTIDRDALLDMLSDALGQHRLDGSVPVGRLADRVVALLEAE